MAIVSCNDLKDVPYHIVLSAAMFQNLIIILLLRCLTTREIIWHRYFYDRFFSGTKELGEKTIKASFHRVLSESMRKLRNRRIRNHMYGGVGGQ